jgi:hypothetical protein
MLLLLIGADDCGDYIDVMGTLETVAMVWMQRDWCCTFLVWRLAVFALEQYTLLKSGLFDAMLATCSGVHRYRYRHRPLRLINT